MNIQNLYAKDAALRIEIENLQRKLRENDDFRGQIVEGTEDLIEKVVQASFGGVVDEVDENEIEESGNVTKTVKHLKDVHPLHGMMFPPLFCLLFEILSTVNSF